jgi:hypothetical protein
VTLTLTSSSGAWSAVVVNPAPAIADTPAAYRLPTTTRVGALTDSAHLDDRAATEAAQLAHQSSSVPVGTSSGTAKIG